MAEAHYHSIRFDDSACHGCMACMRVCPTQAIRIRRGHAAMLEDRCIDCGECIKVCTKSAVVPLTASPAGLGQFDYTVAIPSPALYTQFDLDVTPGTILQALRNSGFDAAATLSWSCCAVTHAIDLFLADYRGPGPAHLVVLPERRPPRPDQVPGTGRSAAARAVAPGGRGARGEAAGVGRHGPAARPHPRRLRDAVPREDGVDCRPSRHGRVVHRLGGRHQRPVPAAGARSSARSRPAGRRCRRRKRRPAWDGRSRSACRARCRRKTRCRCGACPTCCASSTTSTRASSSATRSSSATPASRAA